jgi:hypothetical protein
MVLKIRLLRLVIKIGRMSLKLADGIDAMKAAYGRATAGLAKLKWQKGVKWIARITAVGATVTGAVTAITSVSSASTGIVLGTAGATGTYVTTKGMPVKGYEKIKHVSPKANQRSTPVNVHYTSGSQNKRASVQKPMVQKRS